MTATQMSDQPASSIEHAWNWFKYHAEQRMLVFRFYLLVTGGLGAAYVALVNANRYLPTLLVALSGVGVSYLFWKLDQRTSDLVKLGEAALKKEEESLVARTGHQEFHILARADGNKKRKLGSYSRIFRSMYMLAISVFSLAALYSIYKIANLLNILLHACLLAHGAG